MPLFMDRKAWLGAYWFQSFFHRVTLGFQGRLHLLEMVALADPFKVGLLCVRVPFRMRHDAVSLGEH